MQGAADWAALGACIAEKAENRIMAVLNLPKKMGPTATKQIISCCSPGMNDPILHLMGYTPESPTLEAAFKGKMPKNPERFTVTMDDIVEMYRHINNIAPAPGPERAKPVDIVIFGCPIATFEEVREVARLLKGKKVKDGGDAVGADGHTLLPHGSPIRRRQDHRGGRWQDLPPDLHGDEPGPALPEGHHHRHGQLQVREAWRRLRHELDLR